MNIDINLIPEELRLKPLVDGKTFAAIIVILILAFGSFYFFNAKSDSQTQITNLQSQISTMQQQTATLASEGQGLINEINQLKTAKQGYEAFAASRVRWGNALDGVYSLIPMGVNIGSITQSGNALVIAGSASSYTEVSDYGRALDNDARFSLVGLPSFSKGSFSLNISVAPGGGR